MASVTSVRSELGQVPCRKFSPLLDTAKTDMDELKKIIVGLDTVEKNANTVFDTAGKFIGTTDKQLQDQMKELRVILLNLKVISTHAKASWNAGRKAKPADLQRQSKDADPRGGDPQEPGTVAGEATVIRGLYLAQWFRATN